MSLQTHVALSTPTYTWLGQLHDTLITVPSGGNSISKISHLRRMKKTQKVVQNGVGRIISPYTRHFHFTATKISSNVRVPHRKELYYYSDVYPTPSPI